MTTNPTIYRLKLTSGIHSRIARKLKLGPSGRAHVWRVAHGERTSPRVEAALRAELKRIDRLVAKFEQKLHEGCKGVAA